MGRSYEVDAYPRVRGNLMVGEGASGQIHRMPQMKPFGSGHAALRRARVSNAHQIYHLTMTTFRRRRIFENCEAACAAARCFDDTRYLLQSQMLAWVLMPDHAHCLLSLGDGDSLAAVVTRLKGATARAANAALGRRGQLWSRAFHDHGMRTDEGVIATARYLVANPIRAGMVKRIGDYPFWNAIWL